MVDVLLWYLNRPGLLHDLRETVRQLQAPSTRRTPARSVRTVAHKPGGQRWLSNRLAEDQVRELAAAFEAGATRLELAKRYGIGRTSVAKILRAWRERQKQEGTA